MEARNALHQLFERAETCPKKLMMQHDQGRFSQKGIDSKVHDTIFRFPAREHRKTLIAQ